MLIVIFDVLFKKPIAYCLLPIAYCLLPHASCLMPIQNENKLIT